MAKIRKHQKRKKIHPLIKALVDLVYFDGNFKKSLAKFEREFKRILGYKPDLYNPKGDIFYFAKKRFKLPVDSLVWLRYFHKGSYFKGSEIYLIASVLMQGLRLLKSHGYLKEGDKLYFNIPCRGTKIVKVFSNSKEGISFILGNFPEDGLVIPKLYIKGIIELAEKGEISNNRKKELLMEEFLKDLIAKR
jgi:hypothetical protein